MKKLSGVLCCILFALMFVSCGDSGTSNQITFFDSTANSNELYILSADGKTSTKVNINIPTDAYYIAPNAQGTKVVYCLYDDTTGNTHIYAMGTDNHQVQLTENDTDDCIPSFSPDGKYVAFNTLRNGYVQAFTMNADGSNEKLLVSTNGEDWAPKFSPDNKYVVFAHYDGGVAYATSKTSSSNVWRSAEAKRRLLLQGTRPSIKQSVTSGNLDGVYIVKADGTGVQQLVEDSDAPYLAVPTFSNDGKYILFTTYLFGSYQVARVKTDGTGLTNLSNSSDECYAPMPYGNDVAYNCYLYDSSQFDIFKMRIDGTQQTNLTKTNDKDEYLPTLYFID